MFTQDGTPRHKSKMIIEYLLRQKQIDLRDVPGKEEKSTRDWTIQFSAIKIVWKNNKDTSACC